MEKNDFDRKEELLREREEALAKREAELEAKLEAQNKRGEGGNLKENFYENFRNVPVKYLDFLIGACGIAILVCIILGMLKGRGII